MAENVKLYIFSGRNTDWFASYLNLYQLTTSALGKNIELSPTLGHFTILLFMI